MPLGTMLSECGSPGWNDLSICHSNLVNFGNQRPNDEESDK